MKFTFAAAVSPIFVSRRLGRGAIFLKMGGGSVEKGTGVNKTQVCRNNTEGDNDFGQPSSVRQPILAVLFHTSH